MWLCGPNKNNNNGTQADVNKKGNKKKEKKSKGGKTSNTLSGIFKTEPKLDNVFLFYLFSLIDFIACLFMILF